METAFKREFSHTFLTIQEDEMDPEGYLIHMLLSGKIEGLLPCRLRGINGDSLIYYEVTSKQNLTTYYEKQKLGYDELAAVFTALARITKSLEESLLNPDVLLLNPRFIYREPEENRIYFCCFPHQEGTYGEQLRSLMEYILPKLEHQDNKAVVLGYGIFKESMEENPDIEKIETLLQTSVKEDSKNQTHCERPKEPELLTAEEEIRKCAMDAFFDEEDEAEEKQPYWRIAGCAAALAAFSAVLFLLFHYKLASALEILAGLAIILAAGLLGTAVWLVRRKKTEKKEPPEYEAESRIEPEPQIPVQEMPEENENTVLLNSHHQEKGRFSFLQGDMEGEKKIFILDKEKMIIGKLPFCSDICLPNPAVSRIHGQIQKKGEQDYISDLHSRNGIFLNDEFLEPEKEYLLRSGDILNIADIIFQYFPSTCCTINGKAI